MDMLSIPNRGARDTGGLLAFGGALPVTAFFGMVPMVTLVDVAVGGVVVGNQPTG